MKASLGIDASKKKLDAALIFGDGQVRKKTFANDFKGFEKLLLWVKGYHEGLIHACAEFTGFYDDAVAEFLHSQGIMVSRMNPASIKSFAKLKLTRTKNDAKDSLVIAEFCKLHNPKPWSPPSPQSKYFRDLSRTLEALKEDVLRIQNRLEPYEHIEGPGEGIWRDYLKTAEAKVKEAEGRLKSHIKDHPDLLAQMKLLETIPGVAATTARIVSAEIGDVKNFKDARQLAAFAGLTPCQRQSGSSVNGRTRLSKIGSARLRKCLYMPAIVASRFNPTIAAFVNKLTQRGKCKMSALGAAMRKLLHIIFGVLKHQTPFRENIA